MDKRTLGIFGAFWRSAFDRKLDFFPKLEGAAADAASAETIMPDLSKAMAGWDGLKDAPDCSIDDALVLAKASLAEVKAQTEYQDGKASRLLTVTSFVSALAGFLFTAFSTGFPMDSLHPCTDLLHLLPAAAYFAFLFFVLSALGGALTTFHATRTRFKYPISPKANQEGTALSFLFHGGIVGVSPTGWAESFVKDQGGAVAFRHLKLEYLRNHVGEAYLVAAKTADKLRFLQPAQSMLSWALRFLFLFAVLYAATILAVSPTKPTPKPTTVLLDQAEGPVQVSVVPTDSRNGR
ncbi:hypothetical protein NF701_08785 [Sphingomonadaceae bacterium OTU29THOMA1]|nr:hypothetical protein NF701_08785 [Sphingomonadaceae bacterium OTU29THOMA1]